MTDQKELEELLKSSSSEHQSGQYDYQGDFEPEESGSAANKLSKPSDKTSSKKVQEQSLQDFQLIDEQEELMKKKKSASSKAIAKPIDDQKPKPPPKTNNPGSSNDIKPSKQNPDFSKNKNKKDSAAAAPKKVEQVLTLDQFEEESLPKSPIKSMKVVASSVKNVEESEAPLIEEEVGEELNEEVDEQIADVEPLEESLVHSKQNLESSEEVVSMVVESSVAQSRMTASRNHQEAQKQVVPPKSVFRETTKPTKPIGKPAKKQTPVLKPTSNVPQVISLVEVKEEAQRKSRKASGDIKDPGLRPFTAKPDQKKTAREMMLADDYENRRSSAKKSGTIKVPAVERKSISKPEKEGADKPVTQTPVIRGTLKIPLVPPPKLTEKVLKKKLPEAPNFGPQGVSTTGLNAEQFQKAIDNLKLKRQEEQTKKRQEQENRRRRSHERFNQNGVSLSNLPQGEYQRRLAEKRQCEEQLREKKIVEEEERLEARRQGRSYNTPDKFDRHGISATGLTVQELNQKLEKKRQEEQQKARREKEEAEQLELARKEGRTRSSPPKFDKFGVSATGLSEQELKERVEKQKQKQLLKQKYLQMKKEEEEGKELKRQQKLNKIYKRKQDATDTKSKKEQDDEFKIEADEGEQAQPPDFQQEKEESKSKQDAKSKRNLTHTAKSVSDTSSVKALQAQERIKRQRLRKKEQQEAIEAELKKKINALNRQPEPSKPEKVKELRKLLKEDQLKHIKEEEAAEKKDVNSKEIIQLKEVIRKLRVEQKRLKERIIEQQEIHNRLTNKIRLEEKQDNVLIVDKNKHAYTSFGLVGDLKKIAKTLHAQQVSTRSFTGAEESAVEKFVAYFQSQNYELSEIFACLDVNGDGLLTTKEIKDICTRLNIRNLKPQELDEIVQLLDYNSDGSISKDEFEFLIGTQLEKKTEMKKLLGSIKVDNPIEIEERILDMKARMKYMTEVIEAGGQEQNGQPKSDPKHEKLMAKLKALEDKMQRRRLATINSKKNTLPAKMEIEALSEELRIAEIESANNERLYLTMKTQIDSNIKEKTECLKQRVEEHLRCRQHLYELENDLHEKELRYITYQKIHDNKKRYVEQGKEEQRQRQQRLKEAVEYKAGILNQKTKTELASKLQEMTLISAVLMIQRNFRRKKAMRQYELARQNNPSANRQ